MNYLKTSVSKPILVAGAVTLAVITLSLCAAVGRGLLAANKEKIETYLSGYLNKKLSIGSIYYVPPSFIILKDVKVLAGQEVARPEALSIERVTLVFSLQKLVAKKEFIVSKAYLVKPVINFYEHAGFFRENKQGIVAALKLLAGGGAVKIIVEDAACILNKTKNQFQGVNVSFKVNIREMREVISFGKIDFCVFAARNSRLCLAERVGVEPLEYNFSSALDRDGLRIQDFRIKKGDFQAGFSGVFHKGILRINGNARLDNFYQKALSDSGQTDFMRRIKQFLVYKKWPQKIGIAFGGINISDIKCVFKTHRDRMEIENISFFFNNHPVTISGDWAWGKEPVLNLALLCLPRNSGLSAEKRIKKIETKVTLDFKEKGFDAKILMEILKGGSVNQNRQTIETTFKGAALRLLGKFNLKLSARRLFCSYSENEESYAVALENFESMFPCFPVNPFEVKFKARFLDGTASGKAKIDFQDGIFKPEIFLQIARVNAKDISAIIYPALGRYGGFIESLKDKINGMIFCRVNYKPELLPFWQGQIAVQNGCLEDIQFSNWLADFFNMPELKKIDYKTISFRFLIAGKTVNLEEIFLDSEKAKIKGNFYLKENGLVEGKLSLTLPVALLKTSAKFKLLLALIRNAATEVSFDIQLSGVYGAINFKWLESDFKNRLRKILPGFIKRGIEKKIEKTIREISG